MIKSNIDSLCKQKGISRYKLARNVGMSDRTLLLYERRGLDKAQFGCLIRIAEALECSLEDLIKAPR